MARRRWLLTSLLLLGLAAPLPAAAQAPVIDAPSARDLPASGQTLWGEQRLDWLAWLLRSL